MPSVATRPYVPIPTERPEPRRETLHLGWAPTRRIAPVSSSSGSRTSETSAARPAATTATAKAPKSPPPMKGQTGPRPGY